MASCRSWRAGDCSASGQYNDISHHYQAFVVSQVHGTWGKAEEVPGTAALNQGGFAGPSRCRAPRRATAASAGSTKTDPATSRRSWSTRRTAPWGKAIEVPGTTALNQGGNASLGSVSCAAAGNCSAGGTYTESSGHRQAFVVSQVHGTWGNAEEVPGTATLNTGGFAVFHSVSVSCASAGTCSAGGTYKDASGHSQVFVVSQVHGTWGKPKQVPGTAALNQGGNAKINSVSCAPAGACSAGGGYADIDGLQQAFVVNKT